MSKHIQAIRGMHDILPSDTPYWQMLETAVRRLMRNYSYEEIRMPLVEKTELFVRTIGDVTDIVEKEMYTFEDRNGDSLSLRPEGTASCVRAGIEHGLLHNQIQRLWYMGPMFRHERPQKGRYRQFQQVGVEAFGIASAALDAELIFMTQRLWKALGLNDLQLQLNTLGSSASRIAYREQLVEYFSDHHNELDDDSKKRLTRNPLRILDSKNPALSELIQAAPLLSEFLDEESQQHFSELTALLDARGINYEVNPHLMRGLDYYQKTVFEWVTDQLGAQGTVCAGGRYDGLVEQLGGRATPAAGFALGVDRLMALLQSRDVTPEHDFSQLYLILVGDAVQHAGLQLAETVRDALPEIRLRVNCGGGKFNAQMKRADRSGADIALILAEDEHNNAQISVKYLREERPQKTIGQSKLIEYLDNLMKTRVSK